jgi:hypothetical protein
MGNNINGVQSPSVDVYEKSTFVVVPNYHRAFRSRKNIDVYLQLLVDDLKNLWNESIRVYNASKKETF